MNNLNMPLQIDWMLVILSVVSIFSGCLFLGENCGKKQEDRSDCEN